MSEKSEQQGDQDPAPIRHSDAERVSGAEADNGSGSEQSSPEKENGEPEGDA
jgi:hypothetical protein